MYTHIFYHNIVLSFGGGQGLLVHSVRCRRDDACLVHAGKASTPILKKSLAKLFHLASSPATLYSASRYESFLPVPSPGSDLNQAHCLH